MIFRIIKIDESVVSTILYICECLDDGKICRITLTLKNELLAQGHKFI